MPLYIKDDAVEAREVKLALNEGFEAVDAISRFGKQVGHPAALTMGDAFAHVCAKNAGAALIYKGAYFS